MPGPKDQAVGQEGEGVVGLGGQPPQSPGDLRRHRPIRGPAQRFGLQRRRPRLGGEHRALELADVLPLHRHRPVAGHPGQNLRPDAEGTHQDAGAPVDEPLHQLLMQGVGKPILQRAGAALPFGGALQPVGPVGDVGQGANAREALSQDVDLPARVVQSLELPGDPVLRQPPAALAAG